MNIDDILNHPDKASLLERFNCYVEVRGPEECWPWTGTTAPNGYGVLTFAGKPHRAHRLSYLFANGRIGMYSPKRSMSVCHRCDNPNCVNPAHLFVGTDGDNVRDASAKGRIQRGEKHYAAKLSEEQVLAIRADLRSDRQVALGYEVSSSTVAHIRRDGSWPSLGPVKNNSDRHREAVRRGDNAPAAKITTEIVLAIRADPRTVREIAETHGVTRGNVAAIKARKTWSHLPVRSEDVPARKATRGRMKGTKNSLEPPIGGRLATLRFMVRRMQEQREEMDEGWFVPTAIVDALDRLVPKK
mgnify:FL=1